MRVDQWHSAFRGLGFLFGLTSVMGASCLCFAAEPGAPGPARVAIVDGKWQIGGEVTHRGSR